MTTCRRCTAPTDSTLCWTCTKGLLTDLAALADDLAELEVQATRQNRAGHGGARSAEAPLPYDERAAELLTAARVTLVGWVRDTMPDSRAENGAYSHGTPEPDQRNTQRETGASTGRYGDWPADTLPAILDHLRHVHWTVHPAADEAANDIHDLRTRITHAIDTPPDRHYLGPCTNTDHDGHQCDGDVYAVDEHIPRCTSCAAVYSRDERLAWLTEAAADQLVTAAQAASALTAWGDGRITSDLVRLWAHRGRLAAKGHDRRGRPTYAFAEVRVLALETVTRRRAKVEA